MGSLTDATTIARSPAQVRSYLEDLERHPLMNPDGIKDYRLLSRETRGKGARAAVLVNLLGFWLPGELEVAESVPNLVVLRTATRVARLEFKFTLEGNERSTFVWLELDYRRRHLPPWRLRTRVKQWLRLEKDLKALSERFLKALRDCVEREEREGDGDEAEVSPDQPVFPVDPAREFFEV